MAETPSDTALATKRARWRALRNYGQSTRANITALGWRQDDGNLWDTNLLVPVKSPMLVIDKSLLIGQMRFTLDENGRRTELTLMPPEAYQPAPDFKTKKGKGTADLWTGLQ
jgi:prophage tail gpP-like protein